MAEPDRFGMPGWFKGVRYRSHTEARWAIFLDALDVKFHYEPQGYKTRGVPYLPDFIVFAACGSIWLEIKPTWEADEAGIAKWRLFAAHRPQPSRTALVISLPAVRAVHTVIGGDEDDPLKGPWEDDRQEWRPCPSGHHFDLAYPGTFRAKFPDDKCPDDFGRGGEERIEKAVRAALGYRFGKFGPEGTAALDGRSHVYPPPRRDAGSPEGRRAIERGLPALRGVSLLE